MSPETVDGVQGGDELALDGSAAVGELGRDDVRLSRAAGGRDAVESVRARGDVVGREDADAERFDGGRRSRPRCRDRYHLRARIGRVRSGAKRPALAGDSSIEPDVSSMKKRSSGVCTASTLRVAHAAKPSGAASPNGASEVLSGPASTCP
jgi:hypothetical protein